MKKILAFIMIGMLALAAVGCKTKVRRTPPTLTGVKTSVTVELNGNFDPLKGITAKDKVDGDLTNKITSTFNQEWLQKEGTYQYKVSVTNTNDQTTTADITIIVGSGASGAYFIGPDVVTYYIGSKPFDPLEEIKAFERGTEKELEVSIVDENYTTAIAGSDYSYTVEATDSNGITITKVIKLVVKNEFTEIPNEIPKGNETPITITLWHSNGTTIENAIIEYGKSFESFMLEQHNVKVKVDIAKNGSKYDELRTNFINALKGGALPHIVQNYPDHVVEYDKHGGILPILPYVNHPVWGMQDAPGESFSDILESYREENRKVSLIGDYLSLPFNKSTEVVVYNKDLFDAVLMGEPFPETWQDLFELAPRIMEIKDTYIDKIYKAWSDSGSALAEKVEIIKESFVPFAYDSQGNAFITLTRQFGGEYTDRKSDGKGVLKFDNQQVREMLKFFGEHRSVFTIPPRWEADYASDQFKKGYTALAIGSTAGVRYNTPVSKNTKLFNIGIAPMLYDKDSPSHRSVIQQGTNMSLVKQPTEGKTPEEKLQIQQEQLIAWLFLKYLTSKEIQEDFAIKTGYSPIRNSVYESSKYLSFLEKANLEIPGSGNIEENFELKVKAMAAKAASTQREYMFFDTPFIGSSAARTAVGEAFERVILLPADGDLEKRINDAIQAAIDATNKILN